MSKLPEDLISRAKEILNCDEESWRFNYDYGYDWTKAKIVCFTAPTLRRAIYLAKNGNYFRLNCPEGIIFLNEILEEYAFEENDFKDSDKVEVFLRMLVQLFGDRIGEVATEGLLNRSEIEVSLWMRGKEKDESVFRNLCFEPSFEFTGRQWEVVFNVFNSTGGVEEWTVWGEFNTEMNVNKIIRIEIIPLKDEDTFFWPYVG